MTDEQHGMKVSAGMMLSKFLRQIGREQTEVEGNDPETGRVRIITKAEMLARTMWKLALGWTEETTEEDVASGKKKKIVRQHKPDNAMIALIYDRLEGKTASPESDKGKKQPLSQRVDEQVKKRVNTLVGDSDGGNA